MRFKSVISLAAVALIGLAVSVMAQQPQGQQGQGRGRGGGPPGGGFMGGGVLRSRISFLSIAEVKKELELADEQVAEIEKVNEELRTKYPMFGGRGGGGGNDGKGRRGGNNNEGALNVLPMRTFFVALQEANQQQAQNQQGQGRGRGGFPQFTPEQRAEMEKQRAERTREEKAKLAEILLPNQLKRLNEIFVQANGVRALDDEEIAKQLGISESQKTEMAKVREANDEAMRTKGREAFAGLDEQQRAAKFAEMRKANDDKLLAVLSPAQKSKFEEMKGKPFTMPEGAGRGFGGGNRDRGGNRGNNN